MSIVTIKSVTNGFVVTLPMSSTPPVIGAPNGPTEYVFGNWAEITTFLTEQGFLPQAA